MIGASQPACNWLNPPGERSLQHGQIDVWLIDLDTSPCHADVLDAVETTRLKNFKFDSGRQSYCVAHTAMRIILGSYLNCTPEEVPVTISPGGKPHIIGKPTPLYFNLTHAGNTALLALRTDIEVGIDLESFRELPNILRLAQRTFRGSEIIQLEQSGWNQKMFFEFWTHMEARQKCLGRGVFGEAVSEDAVKTMSLGISSDQCAAIAWPADKEPGILNFYQG